MAKKVSILGEKMKKEATTPNGVEATEDQKLWQDYLQKCCEVGQIGDQLEQLDGQRREMEKSLETTQRAVKSARQKHKEHRTKQLEMSKPKIKEPKNEVPQLEN